jgi:hypothetical protein
MSSVPSGLAEELYSLRAQLESAFAPDTAFALTPMEPNTVPSAGHCAIVAAIVQRSLGGELLRTFVDGEEHWFNRVVRLGQAWDVDLTGDQFARSSVQSAASGDLYAEAELRDFADLNAETLRRASLLAHRSGLEDISQEFLRAARNRS